MAAPCGAIACWPGAPRWSEEQVASKRDWSYAKWGRPQAVNREKRSGELSIKRLILNMDKKKRSGKILLHNQDKKERTFSEQENPIRFTDATFHLCRPD